MALQKCSENDTHTVSRTNGRCTRVSCRTRREEKNCGQGRCHRRSVCAKVLRSLVSKHGLHLASASYGERGWDHQERRLRQAAKGRNKANKGRRDSAQHERHTHSHRRGNSQCLDSNTSRSVPQLFYACMHASIYDHLWRGWKVINTGTRRFWIKLAIPCMGFQSQRSNKGLAWWGCDKVK